MTVYSKFNDALEDICSTLEFKISEVICCVMVWSSVEVAHLCARRLNHRQKSAGVNLSKILTVE
jgi:hypothetical protein